MVALTYCIRDTKEHWRTDEGVGSRTLKIARQLSFGLECQKY